MSVINQIKFEAKMRNVLIVIIGLITISCTINKSSAISEINVKSKLQPIEDSLKVIKSNKEWKTIFEP